MAPIECDICCKKFKVLYLLKRHQQKKYLCEKKTEETHIYECNICNYKFKLVQNYNRHIKKNNCKNIIIKTIITNNNIDKNKTIHNIMNVNNKIQTTTEPKKIDTNYPINNQLINIIVEKTKKIEELIEEKKLLTQNSIEIKLNNEPISNTITTITTNTITLNNIIITSRIEDNYINAIQLCNAGNKIFNDWYNLDTTKDLIKELEKETKCNFINIDSENKDIWIHPDVAIELAHWISPHFSLQVSKWICKLYSNGTNDKLEININSLKSKDDTIKLKEERIKLLEDTYLKRHNRVKYPDKNVIYMITTEHNKSQRNYIIGKAIDLTNRLSTYNKTSEHEVIYYKSCKDEETMNIVECMVLNKLKYYKELANRDRFILPIEKDISFFTNIIEDSVNFFN